MKTPGTSERPQETSVKPQDTSERPHCTSVRHQEIEGQKICTPPFLDSLVPNQPKTAKKSILARKSYGSCFDDISYHTI